MVKAKSSSTRVCLAAARTEQSFGAQYPRLTAYQSTNARLR
jgi:hypothetical protein